MTGSCLGNRYQIRRLLGEGGTAMVYEAMDTLLGRLVAVKVLRPEYSHDDKFVQRFKREASASAQLSHPNIVQVYDVGCDQGVDYIVMEYVDGQTLAEKIRECGQLSIEEAVDLAQQVLTALSHAHEHGVIHRDIKPQNILLTKSGQVKVTDFGIARAVGSATLAGTQAIMGSAHYISPEQARGSHTGGPSDLYSLGVVLFEMLTGTRPFDGETAVTVALKHLQDPIPEPRSLNPAIPQSLQLILQKALAKQVHRRYATAEQFLSDLRSYDHVPAEELIAAQAPTEDTLVLPVLRDGSDAAQAVDAPGFAAGTSRAGWRRTGKARKRSRRRLLTFVLVVMLIFGGTTAATYYLLNGWLNPPLVQVPSLIGSELDEANSQLNALGLQIRIIQERYDDNFPAGAVVWQDPPAGQETKRGSSVNVILSRGPQLVAGGVPDVIGQTARAAEVLLRQEGLDVAVMEEYHPTVPRNRVFAQDPPPGTTTTVGATITLKVSRGPEPELIRLPNFIGRPLDEVRRELAGLGLQIGELNTQISDYPKEFVRNHEPGPGAQVHPGDKINLTVSQGNGIEPETAVITVLLPAEPQEQEVEVRVRDRSERIVYTGLHKGGSQLQTVVYWYKPQAEVLVYVNGELNTSTRLPDMEPEIADAANQDDDPTTGEE